MDTQPKTISVPEAGKIYLGIGRDAAYEAARRGDIPVIQIGKLKRVPIARLESMLADPPPAKSDSESVAVAGSEISKNQPALADE